MRDLKTNPKPKYEPCSGTWASQSNASLKSRRPQNIISQRRSASVMYSQVSCSATQSSRSAGYRNAVKFPCFNGSPDFCCGHGKQRGTSLINLLQDTWTYRSQKLCDLVLFLLGAEIWCLFLPALLINRFIIQIALVFLHVPTHTYCRARFSLLLPVSNNLHNQELLLHWLLIKSE